MIRKLTVRILECPGLEEPAVVQRADPKAEAEGVLCVHSEGVVRLKVSRGCISAGDGWRLENEKLQEMWWAPTLL